MNKQNTFTHNGQSHTIRTTDKAKDIEAFAVKGVRWFQKSYGNTYHKAYISALIGGEWVELGSTEMSYGYGDHYLVTAGEWLASNGYVEVAEECEGYWLSKRDVREAFSVEHYARDVKRQRDL